MTSYCLKTGASCPILAGRRHTCCLRCAGHQAWPKSFPAIENLQTQHGRILSCRSGPCRADSTGSGVPVGHLIGQELDALRAAHESQKAEIVQFRLELAQSKPVFGLWQKHKISGRPLNHGPARRRAHYRNRADARLAYGCQAGERSATAQCDSAVSSHRFRRNFQRGTRLSTKAFRLLLEK